MRLRNRTLARVDTEHLLLLKGLLLWAVIAVAFLAAGHYGLLQRVWRDDTTGLSIAITLVFLATAARSSWQIVGLSRALNDLDRLQRTIVRQPLAGAPAADHADGLPKGYIGEYIRTLYLKARMGGRRLVVDQRLLLETFEAELRSGHELGWFVADLLLSLGLLGTVVGFILMLGPISDIDTSDQAALQAALAAMSGGMAIALYTTLTGLIGGILLKLQGFLLDGAVQELVRRMTRLTEIYVLPAIERRRCDATA